MNDKTRRINQIIDHIEMLQSELEKLEGLPPMIKPSVTSMIRLQKACENYLLALVDGEKDLEDERRYVFDVALEFTYGNIRDWIINRK